MTDLPECPFCGNAWNTGHKESCYFRIRGKSDEDRETVWRSRPRESALEARVAELEAKLAAANEDAERLAKEYLEHLNDGSHIQWEEAGENSPALIIHENRINHNKKENN